MGIEYPKYVNLLKIDLMVLYYNSRCGHLQRLFLTSKSGFGLMCQVFMHILRNALSLRNISQTNPSNMFQRSDIRDMVWKLVTIFNYLCMIRLPCIAEGNSHFMNEHKALITYMWISGSIINVWRARFVLNKLYVLQ